MAERTTITELTQIGVEGTPGTAVAANKKLQAAFIEPSIAAEIDMFRPRGYKYSTLQSLNKESMEASVSGEPTYSELVYLLSSVFTTPTVAQIMDGVTPTGAYRWTYNPSTSVADTPKTFTVESGSAFRAGRFAYGLVTELGLNIGRDNAELDGSMIGTQYEDAVTLTPAATSVPLVPILPGQVDVFMDNTSAGLGTTKLGRLLSVEWTIGDRYNPLWVLDSAKDSWVAHLETEPSLEMVLKVEADSQGMGLLTRMRDGATRFFRLQATGGNIYTGAVTVDHSMKIDMAAKVSDPGDFSDSDGAYTVDWTLQGVHDDTWGKAIVIEMINQVVSL